MANHVIKCRKSQEISGVKECRFNSSHLLPIAEIKVTLLLVDVLRSRTNFSFAYNSLMKPPALIVLSSKTLLIIVWTRFNQVPCLQLVDIAQQKMKLIGIIFRFLPTSHLRKFRTCCFQLI